jgi:chromosome segregation ATPase
VSRLQDALTDCEQRLSSQEAQFKAIVEMGCAQYKQLEERLNSALWAASANADAEHKATAALRALSQANYDVIQAQLRIEALQAQAADWSCEQQPSVWSMSDQEASLFASAFAPELAH